MDNDLFPISPAENTSLERFQQIKQSFMAIGPEWLNHIQGIEFVIDPECISMRSTDMDERAFVSISFSTGSTRHRRLYGGGRSQQLSKALGLDQKKDLSILDATAGLASDSFVMASLGAHVNMLERNPFLSLMIGDALDMALKTEDDGLIEIVQRMTITNADSTHWLSSLEDSTQDVIYLDPMFPERQKKAAVKKDMQVLQRLLSEGSKSESERMAEEEALLQQAIKKAVFRVVVKRPRSAPPLPGPAPSYSLSGKSTRFDIYTHKKIR